MSLLSLGLGKGGLGEEERGEGMKPFQKGLLLKSFRRFSFRIDPILEDFAN